MIEALTSGPTILPVLAGLAAFAVAVVAIKSRSNWPSVSASSPPSSSLGSMPPGSPTCRFCRSGPPAYCAVRSRNTPAAPQSVAAQTDSRKFR